MCTNQIALFFLGMTYELNRMTLKCSMDFMIHGSWEFVRVKAFANLASAGDAFQGRIFPTNFCLWRGGPPSFLVGGAPTTHTQGRST